MKRIIRPPDLCCPFCGVSGKSNIPIRDSYDTPEGRLTIHHCKSCHEKFETLPPDDVADMCPRCLSVPLGVAHFCKGGQ